MEFKIAPEGLKLRDIDVWEDLYEAMERGTSVEAVITRVRRPGGEENGEDNNMGQDKNKGEECWELVFDNKPEIIGLCSIKECGLPDGTPINDFVGQRISCKVRRIEKKNSAVVCSRKEAVESSFNRLVGQLAQGEEINAVVRVVNRHVYVDIGGGAIVRINQDKARLSDGVPLDVQYEVGAIIKVIVTALDKETKHIEVEPSDPWREKHYKRGEVVAGQVIQIRDNLAFVKVRQGLIGRVYYRRSDKYNVGDYIQVQVMDYNQDKHRLHLICYDAKRVNDRRRERAKNRRRQIGLNPQGDEIKTLGGFDAVPGDTQNAEMDDIKKSGKNSPKSSKAVDEVV
ncbi:MAG: RNA-binding protein [Firmicutes bacterium]|nr:RNA-binding protein [Bacillota bacterium]